MTEEERVDVLTAKSHAELQELAVSQDSGLAKVASAMLAWSAGNDLDRLDRQRRDRLLVVQNWLIFVGLAVLIAIGVQGYYQRQTTSTVARRIEDCVGSDPTTQCRKQQAKDQTPVIAGLSLLSACSAAHYAGSDPLACAPVAEKLRQLDEGLNPFAPTTTTKGAP